MPTIPMRTDTAYAELGLPPGASPREVKAAWRRLVSRWHPDRNPSAAAIERMQRINQAFETLRGQAAPGTAPPAPPAPQPRRSPEPPPPPAPPHAPTKVLRRRLALSLEEAAAGGRHLLRGRFSAACAHCQGAGHVGASHPCTTCNGQGTERPPTWFGWFGPAYAANTPCVACAGEGVLRAPCPACDGQGQRTRLPYAVPVDLPPGLRDGAELQVDTRIPVPGPSGLQMPLSLSVAVRVRPHPVLVLQADGSVQCDMPVDGFAWLAEHWVEVPTLTGIHQMRLRRGRLHYRLRGLGFAQTPGGARADYRVSVTPQFADTLTSVQQALLDQLAATASVPGAPATAALKAWQRRLRSSAPAAGRPQKAARP